MSKSVSLKGWKSYLRSNNDDRDFNVKQKSVNVSETSYMVMMDTMEEIQRDEERLWTPYMSDKVKGEVSDYIHNSIQSWELYRISWIQSNTHSVRDIDGVPSSVVKSTMRNISEKETDWGLNGIKNLTIERIDDNEKTHKSQSVDTIGEVYRTMRHQLLHYNCNYHIRSGSL